MANKPTTAAIVNGEAFRAINLLIDQKAKELEHWMTVLKRRVNESPGGYVRVRTSEEVERLGNTEYSLPMHPIEAKDFAEAAQTIMRLDQEISDLQRYKLRLLNDYDFTHGDDTEQRAVFIPAAVPVKAKASGKTAS